ncbi:hypothetical protein DY000_02020591 [Brassica cretica]|uniref:NYN domain-containing protein n=1 Tax=Brassica cretica TaxID=69181 RepID=A0ABQ7EGZ1_BRACR|nr:hypothetical protein DY000_02020591 [Brassica cretica]
MANQTAVATVQYKPFSTFVSAGPVDSKLMFRLIHFWEACNNSKGGILIGTKSRNLRADSLAKEARNSGVLFSHIDQTQPDRASLRNDSCPTTT